MTTTQKKPLSSGNCEGPEIQNPVTGRTTPMIAQATPAVHESTAYELRLGPAVQRRKVERTVSGKSQTTRYGFIVIRHDERTIDGTYYGGEDVDLAKREVLHAMRQVESGALLPSWELRSISSHTPDGTVVETLPSFEVVQVVEGVVCDVSACDYFERVHEVISPTDPPSHSIALRYIELSQHSDEPWELFPIVPEEPTSSRQVAQIIADLTAGERMLADLNAARSKR